MEGAARGRDVAWELGGEMENETEDTDERNYTTCLGTCPSIE